MNNAYDAIIIGTGQAGPFLAKRLSEAGMSVAIAERHLFGGTCVNTGCIPTKAMVASAYAAHMARRAADFGVTVDETGVNMKRVKARKDAIGPVVAVRFVPSCWRLARRPSGLPE
jgi:pyruvate/2-oxoglutarate dehydrogenase complex dihydrolipoamide dehydrogenase (E3) component